MILRSLAPEASASTNFATWARQHRAVLHPPSKVLVVKQKAALSQGRCRESRCRTLLLVFAPIILGFGRYLHVVDVAFIQTTLRRKISPQDVVIPQQVLVVALPSWGTTACEGFHVPSPVPKQPHGASALFPCV